MGEALEPARFRLRAFRAEDAPLLASLCNDIDIARMTRRLPHPYTLQDAETFLSQVLAPEANEVVFAIEASDPGDGAAFALAGSCGWGPRRHAGRVEIGYWLGRDFWGRGLMSAVLAELLRRAFAEPELGAAEASVFEDNPASMRVLKKQGFERMGVSDCRSSARGSDAISYRWELSRAAWAARSKEREQ